MLKVKRVVLCNLKFQSSLTRIVFKEFFLPNSRIKRQRLRMSITLQTKFLSHQMQQLKFHVIKAGLKLFPQLLVKIMMRISLYMSTQEMQAVSFIMIHCIGSSARDPRPNRLSKVCIIFRSALRISLEEQAFMESFWSSHAQKHLKTRKSYHIQR